MIKPTLLAVTVIAAAHCAAFAQVGVGPTRSPMPATPVPFDRPFVGTVVLAIDATDTDHQVFNVHEKIPVQAPGPVTLLYPEWETGSHAPTASVADLAGLVIGADGHRLTWHRDPIDVHAFHLEVPPGTTAIN